MNKHVETLKAELLFSRATSYLKHQQVNTKVKGIVDETGMVVLNWKTMTAHKINRRFRNE